MDFIRSRFSGRVGASGSQHTDLEQGGVPERGQSEAQQQAAERGRFRLGRTQLPSLVSRQPGGVSRLQRRTTNRDEDGPKTPRSHTGPPSLPSGRLAGLRNGSRVSLSQEDVPPTADGSGHRASLQQPRTERFPVVAQPPPTHSRTDSGSGRSRRSFRGADPAEIHLAGLAESGRQRRRRTNSSRAQRGNKPQRFLYCFPWIKSRRMRSQILRCVVSGLFLLMFLIICKCLVPDELSKLVVDCLY